MCPLHTVAFCKSVNIHVSIYIYICIYMDFAWCTERVLYTTSLSGRRRGCLHEFVKVQLPVYGMPHVRRNRVPGVIVAVRCSPDLPDMDKFPRQWICWRWSSTRLWLRSFLECQDGLPVLGCFLKFTFEELDVTSTCSGHLLVGDQAACCPAPLEYAPRNTFERPQITVSLGLIVRRMHRHTAQ
jgi:hypothetical protein